MSLIRAGLSELYCGQNWIVLGRTVLWTELYWAELYGGQNFELYCGQNFFGQNCMVDRTLKLSLVLSTFSHSQGQSGVEYINS